MDTHYEVKCIRIAVKRLLSEQTTFKNQLEQIDKKLRVLEEDLYVGSKEEKLRYDEQYDRIQERLPFDEDNEYSHRPYPPTEY